MLNNENYFSKENSLKYCGSSQYKDFFGSLGKHGCEAMAIAKLNGEWACEKTTPLLVGGYVDAYFEGTLDQFKYDNPEIFTKSGGLKADYLKANEIIEVANNDKLFTQFMSGEKQKIYTGEIEGVPFKIKVDSMLPNAIVDLKVMSSIRKFEWTKDYGKMDYVRYWGYDIQAAIYQEIVRQNTGKKLPFYHAVLSKEKVIDKEIIYIPDDIIDQALYEVKNNMHRLKMLKSGEVEPVRCEHCDYCTATKVLTSPINLYDLEERL